jgi:hypothetical protein
MNEISSVADAVHRMEELIPGADQVVAAHKADLSDFGPAPEPLSGVVPYTLFTELRSYVLEDALLEGKPDEAKLEGLYQFIEEALVATDDMVTGGVSIRIIDKLSRYSELLASASAKPGPRLSQRLGNRR